MIHKIVVLDGYVINPGDLDWSPISQLGDFTVYDDTPEALIIERAKDATILLTNKKKITAQHISELDKLECICILATGTNNVAIEAATKAGITVCNIVGYGSHSVAQHVFALLLELSNHVGHHNTDVQNGGWSNQNQWCYWKNSMVELAGKTMGIYGFGRIGQKVADIAKGFDMNVLATHKHPERDAREDVEFVSLKTLFSQSDFISLNAPLTSQNKEIVNKDLLNLMKPSAFLINTGRGGLIHENDLRTYLIANKIAGAGLDVLSKEPPSSNHPLIGLPNCIITPHNAWTTKEARSRLLKIAGDNLVAFLKGSPQNVVYKN